MTTLSERVAELRGKITPGPWVVDLHHTCVQAGRTYAYLHSRSGEVVPLAAITLGVEGCSQEEGRANAAAIALVPDLLADHARLVEQLAETDRHLAETVKALKPFAAYAKDMDGYGGDIITVRSKAIRTAARVIDAIPAEIMGRIGG